MPTLYLNPPDDAGHIEAAELLENYRKLQARVDLDDPERSLILRKPLNLQTGQEEGHQGGVRYEAGTRATPRCTSGYCVKSSYRLRRGESSPVLTPSLSVGGDGGQVRFSSRSWCRSVLDVCCMLSENVLRTSANPVALQL